MACQENREAFKELQAYYDLDSLVDAQVRELHQGQHRLVKQVAMDSEREEKAIVPDSAGWAREFIIVRDFNLNKPFYVGAYEVVHNGDTTQYTLKKGEDAPVKQMSIIMGAEGLLAGISGTYQESNAVFDHTRHLQLSFMAGLLDEYSISGFQKMILRDSVNYRIIGTVE